MSRTLAGIVAALLATGCSLLPPTIDCGPLTAAACQQRVSQIVTEGQRGDPTRRIVKITFTDDRGSYSAEYDDGTGTMMIVD